MRRFFEQYAFNTGAGPFHEADLPETPPGPLPVRAIAYYLPQFHTFAENDSWWGNGFTEWTNVTKAVPRYVGHLQPRLPADLGFYDLGHSGVLRRQAALARSAGIAGFCIHTYWFGGRRVMEGPVDRLLADRTIDLPFCLNWANENWTRRWDGRNQDVLLEQRYDPADPTGFVRDMLPALRDPRYIRVDGRPLIMVYRPEAIPDPAGMMAAWRSFLKAEGIGDPYLVMPQVFDQEDPRPYGFDAAAGFPPHNSAWFARNEKSYQRLFDARYRGHVASYRSVRESILAKRPTDYVLHPGVMPGWDNEARKPGRGTSIYGATPPEYGDWLARAVDRAAKEPLPDQRLVFINAWNEWAEGAVLEPDRHFGHAYLAETRRVLEGKRVDAPGGVPARLAARSSMPRMLYNRARVVLRRLMPGNV